MQMQNVLFLADAYLFHLHISLKINTVKVKKVLVAQLIEHHNRGRLQDPRRTRTFPDGGATHAAGLDPAGHVDEHEIGRQGSQDKSGV